jgi:hypothetical protein
MNRAALSSLIELLKGNTIKGFSSQPFECEYCTKSSMEFIYLNKGKLVVLLSSLLDLTKICSEECLLESLKTIPEQKLFSELSALGCIELR